MARRGLLVLFEATGVTSSDCDYSRRPESCERSSRRSRDVSVVCATTLPIVTERAS